MRLRPAALALPLSLALAACGESKPPEPSFTFAAVPGMSCADGSATGIGVSRGSSDVLVFLQGGGACWSESACDQSSGLPFSAAELAQGAQQLLPGTILDRTLAGNPFAGFTLVFVPYCTGDVHAGDAVKTYGASGTWRHHGHPNLDAALAWIDANLPRPTRVVVAGSSAGGFGALVAFDLVRARWPESSGVGAAVVDDSGPTFDPAGLPTALTWAWWDAWGLGATVTPLCSKCRDDLSQLWPTLSSAHPNDLLALLSTTQDATMRGFFGQMTGTDFENALARLAGTIDALPNARTFRSSGDGHALFRSPASYQGGATPLLGWLDPIAVGTGAFVSAGP
jgi:hypothetical protein